MPPLPDIEDVLSLWQRAPAELLRLRATNIVLKVVGAAGRGELAEPTDRRTALGVLEAIDRRFDIRSLLAEVPGLAE